MHPQSRVQKIESTRGSHHRFTGFTRHSPRNGVTAYSALSPVIGLVVTVASGILPADLNASVEASGPHDFAVRIRAVRQRHIRVHRIPSRIHDDRERPSSGTGWRGLWI
jgi:hypothetical protein